MFKPFEAFAPAGRLISVIGSGGKTSFLRYLADRLAGSVILTTSTHILPFPDVPLVDTAVLDREQALAGLRSALTRSRVVCLGKPEPSGKLADPSPVIPFEDLLSEAMYESVLSLALVGGFIAVGNLLGDMAADLFLTVPEVEE